MPRVRFSMPVLAPPSHCSTILLVRWTRVHPVHFVIDVANESISLPALAKIVISDMSRLFVILCSLAAVTAFSPAAMLRTTPVAATSRTAVPTALFGRKEAATDKR